MAARRSVKNRSPLQPPTLSGDFCLELQDHSARQISAIHFFGLKKERGAETQAARLANQFVQQNDQLFRMLDTRIEFSYDGSEVSFAVRSGSAIGAVPLISPTTAQPDYGLVIQPRFPWAGVGPMLAEMGWRVTPSPLKLPLMHRSERRVPPWVISSMVLPRIEALLNAMERRFEMATEDRHAPRGQVNWNLYATDRLPRARALAVPCTYPDLRDDRLLKGAIRYTLERQLQALHTQRQHGSFVVFLIDFAERLRGRVISAPALAPGPRSILEWQQRPLRSRHFTDGIQAIEWTAEDRGLAGVSDLEGIPWTMPMELFFEAWVETILERVCQNSGGQMAVGRRNQTTSPIAWDPPFTGSQRSLVPDLWVQWPNLTLIVDAKYKRHWEEIQDHRWTRLEEELREQHRHDLLQVLAYANLAKTETVVACLTYPCSMSNWNLLRDRGRLFHRASLPGQRNIHLWLTAVPMFQWALRLVSLQTDSLLNCVRCSNRNHTLSRPLTVGLNKPG